MHGEAADWQSLYEEACDEIADLRENLRDLDKMLFDTRDELEKVRAHLVAAEKNVRHRLAEAIWREEQEARKELDKSTPGGPTNYRLLGVVAALQRVRDLAEGGVKIDRFSGDVTDLDYRLQSMGG